MSTTSAQQQTLGNYRIGKSIGEGTFGKVRLGIHIPTEQKVAVKTLQKQKIIEQSDIERVTREICILKILRHPNIIQLYEIIQTKTDIHLIMQYAEGGELFDYIVKKKRLDEAEAVTFMQQILSGVQYIHKNGIVHRDLKPQNLLLDQKKNIKIVDFGLSNQYKPGQKLKTACGSPCYAAPQMIAGKKYECLNVDIWSCGIILYAMLCGYLPFEDPNTNKLYKKIIAGEFEMPAKILSSDARDILRNILNVNPQTRYKVQQIRDSKWFNIVKNKYDAKGIVVGKDQIMPDQNIIKKMQKYSVEPLQAKNYVINNRHNHATALYYLLLLKEKKEGIEEETNNTNNTTNSTNTISNTNSNNINNNVIINSNTNKQASVNKERERQPSPIIYRPQKKPNYYIPQEKLKAPNAKDNKDNKDNSKNDSMNVSNIISSLVEANKTKIINNIKHGVKKNDGNFDKQEQFKIFPKKKNSSIHDSSFGNKPLTNRSGIDDKSFETSRNSVSGGNESNPRRFSISANQETQLHSIQLKTGQSAEESHTEPPEEYSINKKRQQLSQQLKLISSKIDKEILQLRKQNNSITSSNQPRRQRDSLSGTQYLASNPQSVNKRTGDSLSHSINQSKQTPKHSTISTATPKVHVGPFNTRCLFMESALTLHKKIIQFLGRNNVRYQQSDAYTFQLGQNQSVWIESIQGAAGLHLINFTKNSPINERIIEDLQI